MRKLTAILLLSSTVVERILFLGLSYDLIKNVLFSFQSNFGLILYLNGFSKDFYLDVNLYISPNRLFYFNGLLGIQFVFMLDICIFLG